MEFVNQRDSIQLQLLLVEGCLNHKQFVIYVVINLLHESFGPKYNVYQNKLTNLEDRDPGPPEPLTNNYNSDINLDILSETLRRMWP